MDETYLQPREQVRERVPTLTENAQDIRGISPGVKNDFGAWSALKLIILVATVNMYTSVISKHADDWFYVDALAGSGISVYKEMEDCFKGSAILAAENAEEQFSKMYFIEDDSDKAQALENRLDAVFDGRTGVDAVEPEHGYKVFEGDANRVLPRITNDMYNIWEQGGGERFYNHLTFVDNQGFDVDWEAIERFADNATGDFLFTFQSGYINRNRHNEDNLNRFFGSDIWKSTDTLDELVDAYCTRLSGISKSRQVVTNVHSGIKNYQYELIYATKDDAGGYVNAIDYVRNFVERVDGADVEEMIEVMYGDQSTIEGFLPEVDDDEEDEADSQSALGDF